METGTLGTADLGLVGGSCSRETEVEFFGLIAASCLEGLFTSKVVGLKAVKMVNLKAVKIVDFMVNMMVA